MEGDDVSEKTDQWRLTETKTNKLGLIRIKSSCNILPNAAKTIHKLLQSKLKKQSEYTNSAKNRGSNKSNISVVYQDMEDAVGRFSI